MSLLVVSEAAKRLGVSARQVQYLVAQGELRRVARGLVEESSVERILAARGDSHRRAWSEPTAWGSVALLSGVEVFWMGESQRSRLRGRLRRLGPSDLVERARGRAKVTRYRAHSAAGGYLVGELIPATQVAGRLGLTETNSVDGYLSADDVDGVVARHGLIRDDLGKVTLRATAMDLDIVRNLSKRSVALVALDLAESLDVRERRAGLNELDRAMGNFRG